MLGFRGLGAGFSHCLWGSLFKGAFNGLLGLKSYDIRVWDLVFE